MMLSCIKTTSLDRTHIMFQYFDAAPFFSGGPVWRALPMAEEPKSDSKPGFRKRFREARHETEHSKGSQRSLVLLGLIVSFAALANLYYQYGGQRGYPFIGEIQKVLEGLIAFATDPLGSVALAVPSTWHILSRIFGVRDHLRESSESAED
jgi:hypothetical protein